MNNSPATTWVPSSKAGIRWISISGFASILLGLLAIAFPMASSIGIGVVLGAVLLLAGIAEAARGVAGRAHRGTDFWAVLFAVLAIAAGLLLLFNPLQGALTLTIVLAAFLLAGGAVKAVAALNIRRRKGWGWLLASGGMSLVLGGLLLAGLPSTGYWALGVLIGIDLIVLGASQIALASGLRNAPV